MALESPETDPRARELPPLSKVQSWATGGVRENQALPWRPPGYAPEARYTAEQQARIEELFSQVLAGKIALSRDLKSWEPTELDERHLAMILMRASGVHQRIVAKAFGATDITVSGVLSHPVAQKVLAELLSMQAVAPNDIDERLKALSEPAITALEDLFTSSDPDTVKVAFRRAPMAFKVLEINGHGQPKKPLEHNHTHTHDLGGATAKQLGALRDAIEESRQLRLPESVEIQEAEIIQRELAQPPTPEGES